MPGTSTIRIVLLYTTRPCIRKRKKWISKRVKSIKQKRTVQVDVLDNILAINIFGSILWHLVFFLFFPLKSFS